MTGETEIKIGIILKDLANDYEYSKIGFNIKFVEPNVTVYGIEVGQLS